MRAASARVVQSNNCVTAQPILSMAKGRYLARGFSRIKQELRQTDANITRLRLRGGWLSFSRWAFGSLETECAGTSLTLGIESGKVGISSLEELSLGGATLDQLRQQVQ